MATATVTPTATSDLNVIWRKVQTGVYQGLNFEVEEYEALDRLKKFKANMSTREITVPLDIQEGYGVASIDEDQYEARPSTPNGRELSLSWEIFNKRFTVTKQARWVSQFSRGAMIEDQFKYQGGKALQALAAGVGDYMWGFGTGVLAQEDGNQGASTTHTLNLHNGYGLTSIAATSDADEEEFVTRKFRVGDYVALIRSAALVTNAIGVVDARSLTAATIDVTWNGSVDPADNDDIVKANSLENTTLVGTDYNRGLTGFCDMATSASLHGLATATEPEWTAGVNDSTGSRLTGVRLHRAAQLIGNYGGGKLTDMWIAQGVERDMILQQQAAVRFASPMGMELDGTVKRKGTTFHTSRRVPPGFAFGYDKASVHKLLLLPNKPGQPIWDDGDKLENRPVYAFNMDLPMQLVCTNRRNLAYFTGLTESD